MKWKFLRQRIKVGISRLERMTVCQRSARKPHLTKAIRELDIEYKGLVKNKNSSKITGLILIDGKSHLIQK